MTVADELAELHTEMAKIPHARYCNADIDAAFPCTCPLSDCLDLLLDRIDTIGRA